MKKKMVILAATVALVGTIGVTRAYAANGGLADIWAARGEMRGSVSAEDREQRWEMRNSLAAQFFGNGGVPSDEMLAERRAARVGLAEQLRRDGLISQELFDIMISSLDWDRSEINAEERTEIRERIFEEGISSDLFNALIEARLSGEWQGGGRGRFWQE